jgi:hypothetical protein
MTKPKTPSERLALILDAIAEDEARSSEHEILEMASEEKRTDTDRETTRALLANTLSPANPELTSGGTVPEASLQSVLARLQEIGIGRDFVYRRIVGDPPPRGRSSSRRSGASDRVMLERIATVSSTIYGWNRNALLGSSTLPTSFSASASARFKVPANAEDRWSVALAVYAKHLGGLLLHVVPAQPRVALPTTAESMRQAILTIDGSLTFASALEFAWRMGIPVLPLNEPGGFHGATWRIAGRNVIVLKQRTTFSSRWLHDLLHELWHAAQNPSAVEFESIDADRMPKERRESQEEKDATAFAGDVVLGGRAEHLADLCVKEARGDVRFLKGAVTRVAAREGVSVDALANYLAFRLSLQGLNWWGAASNLQTQDDPLSLARSMVESHVDFSKLDADGRRLLQLALS